MSSSIHTSLAVHLHRCPDYEDPGLALHISNMLDAVLAGTGHGLRVLVKPNLLKAGNHGLICTHPHVVREVCAHLLDLGHTVMVGDSPAFGSAQSVARATGIADACHLLDVPVRNLNRTVSVRLPSGHRVGMSRLAMESDLIVNLPRLKVHCQMRITGAVKNLFGCVGGARKAVAHTLHGDRANRFRSFILELGQVLPSSVHLMDGILAMHVIGPHRGKAYSLGLLGASSSAVALDTAICSMLGLTPDRVPLWQEALDRSLPGSRLTDLAFPHRGPDDFATDGFVIPETLLAESFNPLRLAVSFFRRSWARLKG